MRSEARALRSTDEGLELNVMRRPSIGAGFRFGSIVTGRARQKTSTVEVDAGRYQELSPNFGDGRAGQAAAVVG
jgi:hypothetical protein